MGDVRRMNVALTRARSSLFVVGSAAALVKGNEKWMRLVTHAKETNAYLEVSKHIADVDMNRYRYAGGGGGF